MSIRKNLLGVNVAFTILVLWLSSSFWIDAFVQRKDAVQLQSSIQHEDALFSIAHDLATERDLVYRLLSVYRADSAQLDTLKTHFIESSTRHAATLNRIKRSRDDISLNDRFRYNTRSLEEQLDKFDLSYQRLEVYRSYLSAQLKLLGSERDQSMRMYMFDRYSDLIHLANNLRFRTLFLPRENNQEVIYTEDLKQSIWNLGESARQIFSLFDGYLLDGSISWTKRENTEVIVSKVSEQHGRMEQAVTEIEEFLENSNFNKDLTEKSVKLVDWYRNDYRDLKRSLLQSITFNKPLVVALGSWRQVAGELHQRTNVLARLTASQNLENAQKVEHKARNNLLIDTLLVLACIGMGAASIGILKKVHHQATHDDLTNLPNRRKFSDVIDDMIGTIDTKTKQLILVTVDLDGFKTINDTMGHAIGDKLLNAVAQRLRDHSDEKMCVARMGGDEFAVAFITEDDNEACSYSKDLQQAMADSFAIDEGIVHIGASLGISRYPNDASSPEQLQINSDLAMFRAKQDGRNSIRFFSQDMADEFENRLYIERGLQEAVETNQFELHYQPQFNLSSNSVDAVEALIRWNHPTRGLLSPVDFITVAEESGLMPAIGEWVLNEACRQTALWVNESKLPLRVAVNVSVHQIMQPGFVDLVLNTIKRHQLDPVYLELEITESVVMASVEVVVQALLEFKQAGIKVALDDFGTGYSSLSQLQELPLSTLKIDRSFIANLEDQIGTSNSVASTIAALARTYGLETVAEGVESEFQLKQLTDLGIDVVQGYYYSKPVSSSDVPAVVSELNFDASQKIKVA